jgi:hypothetical protein
LALSAGTYTNPVDRDQDYNLAGNHVTHDFRANGTISLPFGPNRLLFGHSTGWLARTVEGWQTSVIINANTGGPTSVSAGNMLYGNGVPDVVGPFSAKPFSNLVWNGDAGQYFGSSFAQVPDPQCGRLATELQPYCTLQAVTDAKSGQILLEFTRAPRCSAENSGCRAWAFDAAMSRSVKVTESKTVQFRMDTTNVFNHPLMGTPNLSLNSTTPFGSINLRVRNVANSKPSFASTSKQPQRHRGHEVFSVPLCASVVHFKNFGRTENQPGRVYISANFCNPTMVEVQHLFDGGDGLNTAVNHRCGRGLNF